MLTSEQESKAKLALIRQHIQNASIEESKIKAYERHNTAKTWLALYGLPYRVALDYLKKWDNETLPHKHVFINPCYPLMGYRVKDLPCIIYPNEFIMPERVQGETRTLADLVNEWKGLNGYPKPDILEMAQEQTEHMRPWKNKLDDNWKKYFAHFLGGYDFKSFSEFDFTGEQGTTPEPDINLLRNIYTRIASEYNANKDAYMNDEPLINVEDINEYSEVCYKRIYEVNAYKDIQNYSKQANIENPEPMQTIIVRGVECVCTAQDLNCIEGAVLNE